VERQPVDKSVVLDGVEIHYVDWGGDGPPVVCVHGLTANCRCWDGLAEALAPRYRVLAYDLRGRGDSAKPTTGYNVPTHAGDLLAFIETLALEKPVVIGHSLGAMITVFFASRYPTRPSKLVLIDGGADARPEIVEAVRPAIERLGLSFPSLAAYFDFLRRMPFLRDWNGYMERYYRFDVAEAPDGSVRSKVPRAVIEEEVAAMRAGYNLKEMYRWIRRPALVLRAPEGLQRQDDYILSPAEAIAMVSAMPNARLVEIPGTNHYTILLGKRPAVEAAVLAFLG
jgi:pimeloyl-ACP methyl ester carboxylesterase